MKPKQIIKLVFTAMLLSGCSISVAETRTASEAGGESKIEIERNESQTNKKTPAKTTPTNAVCPDPAKPCKHRGKEFAEWELSFKLPAKITPNKTYSSAPFYAVVLKTYDLEDCDGGEYMEAVERERKKEQAMQLERKVFAYYSCPNMDAVGYDFEGLWDKNRENILIPNFLAVYAGETEEEAQALRKQMLSEYPKATVKKMTATWERIEQ
ncbi:MAG: hypothetical protein M3209_06415 [Acidobacteriota bacterium]|nr:hypothetical protein [Acidobacteriota bacterium]